MEVRHAGWSEEYGSFNYRIFVDEHKKDHEIQFRNGCVARQAEAFHDVTADWNCDGDVYTQFGAYFNCFDRNGKPDGRSFWTPLEMVESLIRTAEGEDRGGYTVVAIPGIVVPDPERRPSLAEQVTRTEQQKMHTDIERNRTMNFLGIRRPGEPWAR